MIKIESDNPLTSEDWARLVEIQKVLKVYILLLVNISANIPFSCHTYISRYYLLKRRSLFGVVFQQLPEPELAIAELVLADLSACRAKPSAFINQAKLGQAKLMEMPL